MEGTVLDSIGVWRMEKKVLDKMIEEAELELCNWQSHSLVLAF